MMRDVHVADVRTTLNVDDDVLLAAKQRAAVEGTSVGGALPAMARDGMRTPKSRGTRGSLVRGGGARVLAHSVSRCDPQVCSIDHLTTSGQVTVSYLLALAGGHDCVLVLGSGH